MDNEEKWVSIREYQERIDTLADMISNASYYDPNLKTWVDNYLKFNYIIEQRYKKVEGRINFFYDYVEDGKGYRHNEKSL